MDITTRPKIRTPPPDTANPSHNTRIGPKIAIFLLLLIPLSLIGLFPDAQAQTVTANVTGDPFTVGEGNSTLGVYTASSNIVDNDNSIDPQIISGLGNHNVDSSERLIIDYTSSANLQYLFIDLDTTLSELQQTISPGGVDLSEVSGGFYWNVTSLTTQNGITDIYLAVFDDDVVTNSHLGTALGAGTAAPLVSDRNPQGSRSITEGGTLQLLFNSTLAGKNIGYIIEFNNRLSLDAGSHPISLDFSLFDADGVAISHITRTFEYTTPEPMPEPQGQAQTVTPTITGDPFTIGEGNQTLNVYSSSHNPIDTDDTILGVPVFGPRLSTVDSSERLIYNAVGSGRTILIDMNTTLSELQQTIGSGSPLPAGSGVFDYNVTSLTTQDGITSIYLGIFDDGAVILEGSYLAGSGIAVPLIENATSERSVTIHLDTVPLLPSYDPLYNNTLADKNIGYIIHFNEPVTFSGEQPISLDFNTFDDTNTPVNHINRTFDYTAPEPTPEIPPGLTPAQQTTYQNLVNAIAARQAAIDQQNVIVDYWSDSSNPFADDRELAQARIDHANSHITQSTIQRDSYQAQLDQLTS